MNTIYISKEKEKDLISLSSLNQGFMDTSSHYLLNNQTIYKKMASTLPNKEQVREKVENLIKEGLSRKIPEVVSYQEEIHNEDGFSGYSMEVEQIEKGILLGDILDNKDIPIEEKLGYLKKVSYFLDRVIDYNHYQELAIGDFHENKILFVDQKIKFLNMDGFYTEDSEVRPYYYLYTNFNLYHKKYENMDFGLTKPNIDTDILCYTMMLLKTISGGNIHLVEEDEYNLYIEYLESLGYGNNLIYALKRIYRKDENINPGDYLDEIPIHAYRKSSYQTFQKKKEKLRKKF